MERKIPKYGVRDMEDNSSENSVRVLEEEEEEGTVEGEDEEILKRRISCHPLYGLLLETHLDCLKVSLGDTGEVGITALNQANSKLHTSMPSRSDLDHFMNYQWLARQLLQKTMRPNPLLPNPVNTVEDLVSKKIPSLRIRAWITLTLIADMSNLISDMAYCSCRLRICSGGCPDWALGHPHFIMHLEAYCMALGELKEAMEEPLQQTAAFVDAMHFQLKELTGTHSTHPPDTKPTSTSSGK